MICSQALDLKTSITMSLRALAAVRKLFALPDLSSVDLSWLSEMRI